jgi:ParB-like chromosome segregation protein Spo0J
MLCPVLVTPDLMILDGHRRVAAARILRWTMVPVNLLHSACDPLELYREVQDDFGDEETELARYQEEDERNELMRELEDDV